MTDGGADFALPPGADLAGVDLAQPQGCVIGGVTYADGTTNPANVCQVCQTSRSTSDWSPGPTGTSCGSALICTDGQCGPDACNIGGTQYAAGTLRPGSDCQICRPATSTSAWSNVSDGTACSGGVCASGMCGNGCIVGGVYYEADKVNPSNACQVCSPAASINQWSAVQDGTSCGTGKQCIGGACRDGCDINGVHYTNGRVNPSNPCQKCDMATSVSSWTAFDGVSTSCGSGKVCWSGACTAGCIVGQYFYRPGGTDSGNNCSSACHPSISTTQLTSNQDGDQCTDANSSWGVCQGRVCKQGCMINGTFYTSGTTQSGNSCRVCSPSKSPTSWSDNDDVACGSSGVCWHGSCQTGCNVNGTLYGPGEQAGCRVCQPNISQVSLTNEPDGTACSILFFGSGTCTNGQCCEAGLCF